MNSPAMTPEQIQAILERQEQRRLAQCRRQAEYYKRNKEQRCAYAKEYYKRKVEKAKAEAEDICA